MSDDGTIIHFPGQGDIPECPVSFERDLQFCRHEQVRLVQHDRNVVCAQCGATIDPFDYLVGEAHAIRRAWSEYASVSAKAKELSQRNEALAKEQRRLAAAIKRQKEKVPDDLLHLRTPR